MVYTEEAAAPPAGIIGQGQDVCYSARAVIFKQ